MPLTGMTGLRAQHHSSGAANRTPCLSTWLCGGLAASRDGGYQGTAPQKLFIMFV